MIKDVFHIFALVLDGNTCDKFRLNNSTVFSSERSNCSDFKRLNIDLKNYELQVKNILTDERIHKISSCNKKSASQMFAGDVLSRVAVNYVFGIPLRELVYKTTEAGKPYLEKYNSIHFNISHSNNVVICAVSNTPIGIDIQYMKSLNIELFTKRFFSEQEQEKILKSKVQKHEFFKLWTKKESFIKYADLRIAGGLKTLDYLGCNFRYFLFLDNYQVCVCRKNNTVLK